ncbi:hypothetical protein GOBAR_DD20963 [Gossypium barbadense]|nr:hypothetical protein GOBAR_DD20963 [Gossypium barbadense]
MGEDRGICRFRELDPIFYRSYLHCNLKWRIIPDSDLTPAVDPDLKASGLFSLRLTAGSRSRITIPISLEVIMLYSSSRSHQGLILPEDYS